MARGGKFSKLMEHPDKNMIVRMLKRGDGVRKVARTLREMYPNEKDKHITEPTLQQFRRERLKLDKELLLQIKKNTKEKDKQIAIKKAETKAERTLQKMPAFQEAVKEAASIHVDIRKELQQLLVTTKARAEDLFNRAESGQLSVNEEANLHRYFAQWTTVIERWAKYIEKVADKTVETNVNINVIEDQMVVLRTAVKETIEETMDAETALIFMKKLGQKMDTLSYRKPREETFEDIYATAQQIGEGIKDAEVDDEN